MRRTFNKSRITRRTLIASTAALPCTALAYQAPISEPNELPDWWKKLVSDLKRSAVPHLGADGWSVVRNERLDTLCEAAGIQEPAPIKHDPHFQWLDKWRVLRAKVRRSEPDSAEEARLFDEAEACERKIMSTPPTTPGGVLAQLEYAIEDSLCGGHLGGDFDGLDTLMFKNIVKALARGVS